MGSLQSKKNCNSWWSTHCIFHDNDCAGLTPQITDTCLELTPQNFVVSQQGDNVDFSWTAAGTAWVYVDVQVNNGCWVYWVPLEWGGDSPNSTEWQMPLAFYGATPGNTVNARMYFGNAQFEGDVTCWTQYVYSSFVVAN